MVCVERLFSGVKFSPLVFVLAAVLLLAPLAACGGGGGGGGSAARPDPITQTTTQWHGSFGVTASQRTKPDGDGATQPLDGRGYTTAIIGSGFRGGEHPNLQNNAGSYQHRRIEVKDNNDHSHDFGVELSGVIGAQGGRGFPRGVAPQASLLLIHPEEAADKSYNHHYASSSIDLSSSGAITSTATYLVNRWEYFRNRRGGTLSGGTLSGASSVTLKQHIEENYGTHDLDDSTVTELQDTVRGKFFKTMADPSNAGKFKFNNAELLDKYTAPDPNAVTPETNKQPLVAVNHPWFWNGTQQVRVSLLRRAVAKFCTDNFTAIRASTHWRGASDADVDNVCGVVDTSREDVNNYGMSAPVYSRLMKSNFLGFRDTMNSVIDAIDAKITTSISGGGTFSLKPETYHAMRDLVYDLGKQGVVTVAHLGNSGQFRKYTGSGTNGISVTREFSGSYPAIYAHPTQNFYAGDATLNPTQEAAKSRELNEFVITVGALESTENSPSFAGVGQDEWYLEYLTNSCGITKARCLFVPIEYFNSSGKRIGMPILDGSDGVYDGTNGIGSASSFAGAVVTGSIALLVQYYKLGTPTYDGVKAAQDLLDTAFGLGTCAGMRGAACRTAGNLDDELGHGLLDLKAALAITQPQNSPGVGLTAGAWDSVPKMHRHGSVLALSTPFGDTATRLRAVLNNAIVIDELGRGHRYALGSMVGSGAGTQIDSLLFAAPAAQGFSIDRELIGDKTISLSFSQNTTPEVSYIEGNAQKKLFASGAPTESFTNLLADSPTLSVSYGDTGTGTGTKGKFSSLFRLSYSDSALTGESRDRHTPDEERGEQQLIRLSGEHRLAKLHSNKPSTRLRWQAALLREDSETLGGANRGVYGLNHGAKTRAFSIGADQPLANGLTLSADITSAKIGAGQGGLIARWDSVRAQGWALSLTHSATDSKTLTGLRLSQPLRTSSGAMDLSYPARYFHEENRVEFDTARVGLRPSGRELRLELTQSRAITPWFDLESRLLYRHEPNHLQAASAEYGASLGIRIRF